MANSRKIWWLLPVICALGGLVACLALYTVARFDSGFAVKEGLVFGALLVLTTSQALWVIRAYPTRVGILAYAVATGIATGCLGAWLHGVALGWLLSGDERTLYAGWLLRTVADRWILYPALLLLFSVVVALHRRLSETEQRYALQQDAAALLKEAELFKLRQQLQPHFLYNSLNAIAALVITAPDKAGEMISRLADFLRTAVKQGRSELVPVNEELDYLKQYLWIEAVRFGDRLNIDWAVHEETGNALMPPFLLQPIMENAIRFAIYGKTGAVTISISIQMSGGVLRIAICNPFDPSMKAASGTGFGLEGIRRRLYLTYARQDLLQATEADGHFTTTLLIPQ
jgi:hypothetical protein